MDSLVADAERIDISRQGQRAGKVARLHGTETTTVGLTLLFNRHLALYRQVTPVHFRGDFHFAVVRNRNAGLVAVGHFGEVELGLSTKAHAAAEATTILERIHIEQGRIEVVQVKSRQHLLHALVYLLLHLLHLHERILPAPQRVAVELRIDRRRGQGAAAMMALARQHTELASAMIALHNKWQLLEKAGKQE
jgi:hypothetical protein